MPARPVTRTVSPTSLGAGRPATLQVVPGVVLEALLGFGPSGEVWRARDARDGEPLAIKRLRIGPDPAERERARKAADRVVEFDHPHVVRVRGHVTTREGLALRLDLVSGANLASLLARRRRLDPGEVVTLGVPLAEALAAAHAAGLTHGDLGPQDVLLTADGEPLLTDLGLLPVLGLRPVEAADDVRALADLCHAALGATAGPAAAAVLAALQTARYDDPSARCDAAGLAAALALATRPAPLRLNAPPAPALPGEPAPAAGRLRLPRLRAHGHAPLSRRAAGVLAVGALGAALLAAGVAWAVTGARAPALAAPMALPTAAAAERATAVPEPTHSATMPTGRGPTKPGDPAANRGTAAASAFVGVLARLDRARDRALAAVDPRSLASVDAAGSAAEAADRGTVAALTDLRVTRVVGLKTTVTALAVQSTAADRVVLAVTDERSAADALDSDGRVLRHYPARGAERWTVALVRRGGDWLVANVAAA